MSIHDRLSDAIESGDVATVRQVVSEQPAIVNSPEWTPPPLHCAVLWDQPRVAELLLQFGADIEMRDPDRATTPLRYAILHNKPELIRLLVHRGANTGKLAGGETTAMELARAAAAGQYEEYDDLPGKAAYRNIVKLLEQLGLE